MSRVVVVAALRVALLVIVLFAQINASFAQTALKWTQGAPSSAAACAALCSGLGGMKKVGPMEPNPYNACVYQASCECNISLPGQVNSGCVPGDLIGYKCGQVVCGDLNTLAARNFSTSSDACFKCPQECPTTQPVYPSRGAKFETVIDYATAGSSKLTVERFYSSSQAHLRQGGLGAGWAFSFDYVLTKSSNTDFFLASPDGSMSEYLADTSGIFKPSAMPALSSAVRNTAPSESFDLTFPDDTVVRFERAPGDVTSATFRPTSLKDRAGYLRTITRDADGRVLTMSDNLGRSLTYTWTGDQLTQVTAPGGVLVKYTYNYAEQFNGGNELTSKRLATASVSVGTSVETTTYLYEDLNYVFGLTGITDARGLRYKTIAYDAYGMVSESGLSDGSDRTTFAYGSNQTTLTNALGKQSKLNYQYLNGANRLTGVDGVASTNCPASSKAITYNTDGSFDTLTDEEGRVTKYVNDARGQPTSITRGYGTPDAVTTSYTYHPTLHVPTQMVEPGKTTNYTWDASGRMTSLQEVDTTTTTVPYSTNGQSRTTTYIYTTTAGLLAWVDGPLNGSGDAVGYTYDVNGYVKTITNQVGHVTTVNTVNGRGQPTQITDPNGIVSNLTYDFQGRLLTVTVNPGAAQAVTTMTYDSVGNITKITRPDGSFLSYAYNDARRLTTVANNTGETINYTYDLLGGITSRVIKSTAGAITFSQTQTFDELGRLLKHIGGDFNQTTTFAYEKNNNLKSITDPRSGLYSYGYDSLNRLITTTDQENSVVTLTRDGQDNTTAYKDPRNLTTTYVRNGFGEIIQEISPDRGSTVTFRDARGLATTVYDGRGIGVIITYDNAGRILTKTYPAATAENATYTYDDLTGGNVGKGRLTRLTDQTGSIDFLYDVRGNVTQETRTISGQAHVVAYAYDLADRIAQITYPSGRIVTYTRDTTGRITAVATKQTATAAPVTVASAITYQPMSNLPTYLAYGNGLGETALHTRDYEIYAITVVDGANVVFNIGYARLDKLNITNASSSPNPAHSFSAGYTGANRLGYISGVYGSKSYTFDGVGNRTNEMTTVGSTTTSDNYFLLPNTNRVGYVNRAGTTIRTLTYDNAGNLLTDSGSGGSKAYTYNKRNRLSVATVGALTYTYTYNALEQLASRVASSPAATTHFIHDRFGNVIAETAGGGATGTTGTVREYIYLPEAEIAPTMSSRTVVDRPLAVIDAVNTSPVTYWVSVDHLHRPVKLTSAAKASVWDAVWLPWGGVQSITGTVTLNTRFPGQWFQTETGLHYNWHRHYDPTLGSYTQPDPLGFVDGPSVYGYAGGSPQALVDPDGRSAAGATGVLGGPAGWVLGGAATYCAIFPDACRKILEQCLNFFFDSSGRSPPAPPPPPPPPKRDYDCEKDWLRDHKWCSKKYWGINASIGVACHAWANNNLYRCLAGTQRQPWSEVGAKR